MTKIVVALLLAGVALVGVELGLGALNQPSPAIANPCHPREGRTGGIDATVQRIVLDGLDGAACRLHTTREELVLSIGGGSLAPRHWDPHTIDVAVRAGLLRSVDDGGAARRHPETSPCPCCSSCRAPPDREADPRRDQPERPVFG